MANISVNCMVLQGILSSILGAEDDRLDGNSYLYINSALSNQPGILGSASECLACQDMAPRVGWTQVLVR